MSDLPAVDALDGVPHPKDCGTLIGHESAEAEFLDSFNGGRFHHAWLISGVSGLGKASFAYRAAKFLLSQTGGDGLFGPPDSLDVDPGHQAISLINAGAHPGLTILRRQYDDKGKKFYKNVRIDDVRGLNDFFGMTSSDGGWRVVIVDAADDLNINAANALLKILEEPPKKTIFFLLSHSPAALLPTIRSRCRRLALQPLNSTQVADVVRPLAPDLDEPSLDALTFIAEGSPGKALALYKAGGLDAFLGILELFNSYPKYDPEKLHGLADLAAKKESEALYRVLCELIPWWLSRFVRTVSMGIEYVSLIEGEAAIMQKLADQQPLSFWVEMWEKTNHLIERADTVNLDRKQVILNLFLMPTLKK